MKKMVICLLLALLCLLPCTTALAAETGSENNTTTPTADDPYYKGESDDNSDADDLQWYRDNAALLENNNIVGDALRSVSWSITGLVCKVANVAETLYTKTFGLIDITNYPQINDLLDPLRPVLLALTVLCCAGLGIMLLVQHEKRPPLLRNILLGIVAVSASAWLFSTANDLVIAFRDGILGGEEVNQSYELVESNLIDLIRIDKRGDINALNYKAGQGVIYGVGIASQDDMDSIDLCETLDWHTAKNGKNLYGWSPAFNNRVSPRALLAFLQHRPDVSQINLCTDGDRAGEQCAESIRTLLEGQYEISREAAPIGKDWNESLVRIRELKESWEHETNDPETETWRGNLTPQEAQIVAAWDDGFDHGLTRMAADILSRTQDDPGLRSAMAKLDPVEQVRSPFARKAEDWTY